MPATDLSAATRLALERTRLAHERTMMAWIRTAASLISFGFTIYKFFQYLQQGQKGPSGAIGPRGFALILIGVGLGSLAIAAVEQRRNLQALRKEYGELPFSLAAIAGALVALLGVFGFGIVLLRQ